MADAQTAALAAGLLVLTLLTGGRRAEARGHDAAVKEAAQLSALAPAAMRLGLRLQLRAANGRTVRFDSVQPLDDAHAAESVDFRLNGVTRNGRFFVVSAQGYESRTLFWVSRVTGQKTEVHAPPEVSPDGRWAVTALHEESFGPQGVFIWQIRGNELQQRAHLRHADYGLFTFRRWMDGNQAELGLYSHSHLQFCPGSTATTATVTLAPGHRGWVLFGPDPRQIRCE